MLLARPAAIALPTGIDLEGRAVIVVERAQGQEFAAGRLQAEVAAHDIDDVVGLLHLGYPVVGQGPPRWQSKGRAYFSRHRGRVRIGSGCNRPRTRRKGATASPAGDVPRMALRER